MFSFSALFVVSTLACSIVTSALPLNTPVGDLRVPSVPGPTGIASRDVPRVESLSAIITTLEAGISGPANALKSVTPQNAMYDNIRGPIVEIHDEFSRALASVRSLVDHFKEGVLAPIAEVNTEDARGYFEEIIDGLLETVEDFSDAVLNAFTPVGSAELLFGLNAPVSTLVATTKALPDDHRR
ncbi:hypothetical protein OH76DRAFT_280629 [Lentinus brumalis]|uniref:Uncharacterized protein n=1 Tax=Lentinus brumalis TaxID=2498619 RepID=A0A371CL16_9APHY|nr:hypothetical protein OH76DRAFT_280629 [Polyporus brumalis]